jgi:hypothetical protein
VKVSEILPRSCWQIRVVAERQWRQLTWHDEGKPAEQVTVHPIRG